MKTSDHTQNDLFCAKTLEQLVPTNHRLRHLRPLVDEALRQLQPQFRKLYSHTGRPGIAPERLLRALLLQVLYGVRSERRLMEELACHMAWRWFVGLSLNEEVWDVTVFTKNRERFLQGDLAQRWLVAVVEMLRQRRLIGVNQPRLDLLELRKEVGQLRNQVTNHWEVAERFDANLRSRLRVVRQERGAGELGLAVDHHAATAADAHSARPAEGESAILCVLDVVQSVKDDPFAADWHFEAVEVRLGVAFGRIPCNLEGDGFCHVSSPLS